LDKRTIRLERTKTGKSRTIFINSVLLGVLMGLKKPQGKSSFVFLGPSGKPIADVKHSFRAACRRAEIKGLRFHDLRHYAATRMVEAGVDLVTVSKVLGHASIQTTMRYAHPTPENMQRAVEVLAKGIIIEE
jgi:integrase